MEQIRRSFGRHGRCDRRHWLGRRELCEYVHPLPSASGNPEIEYAKRPKKTQPKRMWGCHYKLAEWLAFMLGLSACVASTVLAQATHEPRDPAHLYDRTCHFCHDTGIGPPLKGSHYPADRIRTAVRHGHGAMIAFTPSEITDSELTALAQMLNQSSQPRAPR